MRLLALDYGALYCGRVGSFPKDKMDQWVILALEYGALYAEHGGSDFESKTLRIFQGYFKDLAGIISCKSRLPPLRLPTG